LKKGTACLVYAATMSYYFD